MEHQPEDIPETIYTDGSDENGKTGGAMVIDESKNKIPIERNSIYKTNASAAKASFGHMFSSPSKGEREDAHRGDAYRGNDHRGNLMRGLGHPGVNLPSQGMPVPAKQSH